MTKYIEIMKFYTHISSTVKPFYDEELLAYRISYAHQDYRTAWYHLERAHILGQRYPIAHTHVHWLMLRFGIRIKSVREVVGQVPRLLVGGIKSFVGKVPVGNPGGANVPALKPFDIPADLKEVLAYNES